MKFQRLACLVVLLIASTLCAQVQTEFPPTVPGAKPVTVERIKIHGYSLDGNLEGNAEPLIRNQTHGRAPAADGAVGDLISLILYPRSESIFSA